jgi:tetratricopeptide (TPR) repeat protein
VTVVALTDPQSRLNFFQERILFNIDYWRSYLSHHEITALDAERNQIIKAIAFALELQEAWPSVCPLMLNFSPYMERRGYWDEWKHILSQALQVAHTLQDQKTEVNLSILIARLSFQQNQFKTAIKFYRHTSQIARQIGDIFNTARAYTNLGFYFIERGDWQRAEVLCCHALRLFEQVGSDHGRAHTANHLGFLYTRKRFWNRAEQYLERACATWRAMDDHHGLMRGLINLSLLYIDMEQYDKSLLYSAQALEQARLTGEEASIGIIYMNMGIALSQKGELKQAEVYHGQAEAIFRRFANLWYQVLVWINLSLVYIEQKRWADARRFLESALTTCRELNHKYGEIEAVQGFVEYELARGNEPEIIVWLKELKCLVQSHDWEVRSRRLQALALKYHRSLPAL